MQIIFTGTNSNFLEDAFFGYDGLDVTGSNMAATQYVLTQPETGAITTVHGTGFSYVGNELIAGTITSMDFRNSSNVLQAQTSGFSWTVAELIAALQAADADNLNPLGDLFGASYTLDASGAASFDMSDWSELMMAVSGNGNIVGTSGSDNLYSGPGNDVINPGASQGDDQLHGSTGNDSYNFGGATGSVTIEYSAVAGPITVNADSANDTLSVVGSGWTDSFANIATAYEYAITIYGTTGNDTFNVNMNNWTSFALVGGGEGADTYNVNTSLDGGFTRIYLGSSGTQAATQGAVIDMSTGTIQNDGFGYTDHINVTGDGQGVQIEVSGTHYGDSFTGGDDNDRFRAAGGNDTIDGGAGIDRVRFDESGFSTVTVDLAAGTATGTHNGTTFNSSLTSVEYLRGSEGDDTFLGSGESERFEGKDGDDSIRAHGGDDSLMGENGNDTLNAGAGDDTVDGGAGNDTAVLGVTRDSATVTEQVDGSILIESAEGTDIYIDVEQFQFDDGTVSLEVLLGGGDGGGGTQGDTVVGTEGDDTLIGTGGDDVIAGGGGSDSLSGGDGNDNISGSDGDDSIDGGTGNDNVGGGLGDDILTGSSGNDTIGGGMGDDLVLGNEGDDVLAGGAGNDTLFGGDGDDTIGASYGNDAVDGDAGNDSLGGGTGRDTLDGGAGNDSIGGGEGDDVVTGGEGDDFLAGGGRHDEIDGGAGDDVINGGNGDDTMTGGSGADQFVFNGFNDGDADVITDWTNGEDTFRMSGIDNAPGSGLQGYVDALNIVNTAQGAQMSYEGHTILLEGVNAAELGLEDFTFL